MEIYPEYSPILLLDFFRCFFTVYESMKINREKLGIEISNFVKQMENRNNKKKTYLTQETVLENGLTNNSKIRIYLNTKNENSYIKENNLKFKFILLNSNNSNYFSEMNLNILDQKVKMKVDNSEARIRVSLIDLNVSKLEMPLDEFSIREILDSKSFKTYNYNEMKFVFSFIWVNSKINYYNKEITLLEEQINLNKEAINVLNNSIVHIEDTFRKYFQNTGNKFEEIHIGTMKGEIEISQKIEDYMLKIVGKEVIIWDTIVFITNKIILPFLFLLFFERSDFPTVLFIIYN